MILDALSQLMNGGGQQQDSGGGILGQLLQVAMRNDPRSGMFPYAEGPEADKIVGPSAWRGSQVQQQYGQPREELSQRWRNMARGRDQFVNEAQEGAQVPFGRGDAYQTIAGETPLGKFLRQQFKTYNEPDAWERRILVTHPATAPYARFNDSGQLINADELRGLLPPR